MLYVLSSFVFNLWVQAVGFFLIYISPHLRGISRALIYVFDSEIYPSRCRGMGLKAAVRAA